MKKFLIVGLGNIGEEYRFTRHNIGFDILDVMAESFQLSFSLEKLGMTTSFNHKGKKIFLLKPTTYMNLSGKAVKYWMDKEKIPIENIIIVTDDIHLGLEKIRLRGKGSAGGHNGLKDINEKLNSQKYARLRFGVGNSFSDGKQVNFVLGKWKPEEMKMVAEKTQVSIDCILSFVLEGINNAMNKFNSITVE